MNEHCWRTCVEAGQHLSVEEHVTTIYYNNGRVVTNLKDYGPCDCPWHVKQAEHREAMKAAHCDERLACPDFDAEDPLALYGAVVEQIRKLKERGILPNILQCNSLTGHALAMVGMDAYLREKSLKRWPHRFNLFGAIWVEDTNMEDGEVRVIRIPEAME